MTDQRTDRINQIRLAKEYFNKVDAGDPTLFDVFTDDVQGYFPKYGTAHGKAEVAEMVKGLSSAVPQFRHDETTYVFTQEGNRLAAEGIESGFFADGTPWPAGARSGGRFCNVFEFRDGLISRVHIHSDPDYAGRHNEQFPWEKAQKSDDS